MKRAHSAISQGPSVTIRSDDVLISPYTIHVPHEEVKGRLNGIRENFYAQFLDYDCFPWLLKDQGEDFDEKECRHSYLFNVTDKSLAGRCKSLVDYLNRWFCVVTDEPGCDKVYKKSWDADNCTFLLVEKANLKAHLTSCTVPNYIRHPTDPNGWIAGDKKLNPATIWLGSSERRKYKRKAFSPDTYENMMRFMYDDDNSALSSLEFDRLNKFTGWGVDPRFTSLFVKHRDNPENFVSKKGELSIENYYGWCKPIFVDRTSPSFLTARFGLGSILTGYPHIYKEPDSDRMIVGEVFDHYVRGPPHPDNSEYWPEHVENLIYIAHSIPEARYLIGGDPEADLAEQEHHLLKYFGRPGDPWGDCGFSIAPWLEFVYRALCCSDMRLYDYIMSWCASLRKRVGKPNSSTVCLFHKQNGGGKSMFMGTLTSIVGEPWCLVTSEATDIVGDFTAAAADKILVFLDEVKFSKSMKSQHMSNLKNLLTGKQVRINRKGIDVVNEKKYLNILMSTNEENFLVANPQERRHCAMQIHPEVNGKDNYLTSLCNMMRGTGRCFPPVFDRKLDDSAIGLGIVHFSTFLDQWNIDRWSEWPIPKTPFLFQLQIAGWSSVARWWYHKLYSGSLYARQDIDWPVENDTARQARDLIYAQRVWGASSAEDMVGKLQEFTRLSNLYYTLSTRISDSDLRKFTRLNSELETARNWNPLWPKHLLYQMYLKDVRETGSTYNIAEAHTFNRELLTELIFGSSAEVKRATSKRVVCSVPNQRMEDIERDRRGRALPVDEDNSRRVLIQETGNSVRLEDLQSNRVRVAYVQIPDLVTCRKNFKEALQLKGFSARTLWGDFDSSEEYDAGDDEALLDFAHAIDPKDFGESNNQCDYLTKPWTRFDFWDHVSAKQLQVLVKNSKELGALSERNSAPGFQRRLFAKGGRFELPDMDQDLPSYALNPLLVEGVLGQTYDKPRLDKGKEKVKETDEPEDNPIFTVVSHPPTAGPHALCLSEIARFLEVEEEA